MIWIILGLGAGLVLAGYAYSQYKKKQFQKRHSLADEDMAAFTDWFRDHGIQKANQYYPHVALHMLECADCNELFGMLQETLDDPNLQLNMNWKKEA